MNTLAPIANRLAKLVRLLTSDRDGEVVAAARSINRTLKSAGLDIHALAAEIENSGPAAGRGEATNNKQLDWHAIACECAGHDDRLRDHRERVFVQDMLRWTKLGGKPTEKQARWLRSIYIRR